MGTSWVKVTEIQDGMVLAKALEDEMGRVLLRAGHELSAAYSARLQKMGVNEVLVEVKDGMAESDRHLAVGSGNASHTRRVTMDKLAQRFEPHQGNPIMVKIQQVAAQRLAQGASE